MSLSLFIARRIYRESDGGKQVSRPAVLIAMAGFANGFGVMIFAGAGVLRGCGGGERKSLMCCF